MKTTIVNSSDDKYSLITANSIYSLIEKNPNYKQYKILVFSNNISPKNISILRKILMGKDVEFEIIELGSKLENLARELNLPPISGNYSTYLRLFINKIYSKLNNVLFIDSDTIVTDSIDKLFNFDFKGNVAAGVVDIGVYRKNGHYEDGDILKSTSFYFNAGILLIDFHLWREKDLDARSLELISRSPNRKWKNQEQSILNVLLSGLVLPIGIEYNFYSIFHLFHFKTLVKKFGLEKFIIEKDFDFAKENPAIIHFGAPYYFRPWYKNSVSPYKELYQSNVIKAKIDFDMKQLNPITPRKVYAIFDMLNYLLLKNRFIKLYFFFQTVVSGITKKALKKLFGVR